MSIKSVVKHVSAIKAMSDALYQAILVSTNDKDRALSVAHNHSEIVVDAIIEAVLERIAKDDVEEEVEKRR